MCLYLYVYSVSSPYLLVFDNDRVRGIREHMILHVDLVRVRDRAGIVLGEDFIRVLLILYFKDFVNIWSI